MNAELQIFDALPAPAPRKIREGRKYLTAAAVSAAKENPGKPVLLRGGHHVDEVYEPIIRLQAQKLGEGFRTDWVFREDKVNPNTKSGTTSYARMGWIFLTYTGDSSEAKPVTPKKKAKKMLAEHSAA
ncbi:hypothetical protein J4H92_09860 [Leucobacter weissii]|uniref:Uncharacterized protein n=1 Tax=Leucobacter weissii TaxID=1983706 RepID=A0A939MLT6_9MICO|nr:hypothetical protein [Leucobacter weissii]MBO1902250.1 hypothetical protein [Leucobacter weissii]